MEFITKDEMYDRLYRYAPPVGEAYYLRRHFGRLYSSVGINFRDRAGNVGPWPLFDIYTGNQEFYLTIRDMIHEVADELNSGFVFDQWQDENGHQSSGSVIADPSAGEHTAGVRCGAGVSGMCREIIGEPEVSRLFMFS